MSVTSLVRDKSFLKRLRAIYPARRLTPAGPIRVAREHERSDHIGTAFDYLFRVVLARAANMVQPHLLWDADFAPRRMSPQDDELAVSMTFPGGKTIHGSRFQAGVGTRRHVWAHGVLAEAKRQAAAFHENGVLTDALLWVCYQLSFLDLVVRGGSDKAMHVDPEKLSAPDQCAIDELRRLVELIDLTDLRIRTSLFLAPTLEADDLTGGGAPDLFVDGWVCEIKAVTSLSDAARWMDQLVVYAALVAMGGFSLRNGDRWTASGSFMPRVVRHEAPVVGVAIYFARHAEWVRVSLDEIFTIEQLLKVGSLLCEPLKRSDAESNADRQTLLTDMAAFLRVRSSNATGEGKLTALQQSTLDRLKREERILSQDLSTSDAFAMNKLRAKGLAYRMMMERGQIAWELP